MELTPDREFLVEIAILNQNNNILIFFFANSIILFDFNKMDIYLFMFDFFINLYLIIS